MLRRLFLILFDTLFPEEDPLFRRLSEGRSFDQEKLPRAENLSDPGMHALFSYADPQIKNLIWKLKYRGSTRAAAITAKILYVYMTEHLKIQLPSQPALLVPIPLHPRRERERGFNQCDLMCREILKLDTEHRLEYAPSLLKKIRHTDPQSKSRGKSARLHNLKGCFEANKNLITKDRLIIIIDDVITTGETMRQARTAFRKAGARKIICLGVAH